MKCELIKTVGTWRDVADAARTTVHMEAGTGEPSYGWKRTMLLAQHSPIRKLAFNWKWIDIPYWVSVHLVRHKFGIEHWVSTQRTDRTGEERDGKRQDAPVVHECLANAESLIFIARRRLCSCAAPETRKAVQMLKDEIAKVDPAVASCMVPECVYRGFCPELKSCGFSESDEYVGMLNEYRHKMTKGEQQMNTMKLKFKKLTPTAKLPVYAHAGDSGMDICADEDVQILPHSFAKIHTGIAAVIPDGYEIQVRPRSGMQCVKGIVGAWGTVDSQYRGEIGVALYNHTDAPYVVKLGDRIAQLVLAPVTRAEIEETDDLGEATERGADGFGSTGR